MNFRRFTVRRSRLMLERECGGMHDSGSCDGGDWDGCCWRTAACALSFLAMGLSPARLGLQREATRRTGSGIPRAERALVPGRDAVLPQGDSRSRKMSRLALDATADNALRALSRRQARGRGNRLDRSQSVEAKLSIGPHVLAARATNEAPGPAGFLVRGGVLPLGQGVPDPHRRELEDGRPGSTRRGLDAGRLRRPRLDASR